MLGWEGLLSDLSRRVLERALSAELAEHLGYEGNDPAGDNSGNSRIGTTPETVHTEAGSIELDVPRVRDGSFDRQIVPKGVTRPEGLSARVVALYADGRTVREHACQLAELYGVEVSREWISRVTDEVADEVRAWQTHPLDPVYPVISLDAIVCKVRDEGAVRNQHAHLAVGIDVEGRKHVLGMWIQTNEGAKFWLWRRQRARGAAASPTCWWPSVTASKGLPEAIESVWPEAWVQTCIVGPTRASLNLVSDKDRKRVASALKAIYAAESEQAAEAALEAVEHDWGQRYPGIARMGRDAWERVIPFLAFPPEIRTVI